MRILLLVPDLMFSVRIADAVRAQGWEPREVASGRTLLGEARAGAAAIVLDTQARNDWLDAVKELKADAATAAIPILAYGSHVDVEAQRAAVQAGVDRLVTRGKLVAELPELLKRLVAKESDPRNQSTYQGE